MLSPQQGAMSGNPDSTQTPRVILHLLAGKRSAKRQKAEGSGL